MTSKKSNNKYLFPLIVMATLFFLLGFITTMNNSMIDFLKDAFKLGEVEKQLPNTFFYGAYVLSVPVGFLIHRIGYKKGVLAGLGMIALGFFLCIPAVGMGYFAFLSAVSVFAIGVVLLQVAANPYVNALGSPETAASRLTLTNALNSVATVIAPIFVSLLIVTDTKDPKAVQGPFGIIGGIMVAILLVMFFLKLPEIKGEEDGSTGKVKTYKSSAFNYTHMWLGSLAIFFYMGIEIGIPSFFADYSTKSLGFDFSSVQRTDMLKYYWGGLMVGRLLGIFILQKYTARQLLMICSLGGAALVSASLAIGASASTIALWAFLGTGLFHSIMWPTIYNLALEDLGPHAKIGSGVIATSVIGAALLTPMMGAIQRSAGLSIAICCLLVYYAYLVFFAAKGSKIR
jgi:MFS transporter, FHS family, L-fucose permease